MFSSGFWTVLAHAVDRIAAGFLTTWSTSLRTSWADVATTVGCPQCCCWMLATVLMFCCSVVLEISSLSRYLLVGTWSERFGIYMGIFHVFFWLHGADVTVWTQWAGASFGGARRSLTFGATLSRDLEFLSLSFGWNLSLRFGIYRRKF